VLTSSASLGSGPVSVESITLSTSRSIEAKERYSLGSEETRMGEVIRLPERAGLAGRLTIILGLAVL